MKNILPLLLAIITLAACSSSKDSVKDNKEEAQEQLIGNGNNDMAYRVHNIWMADSIVGTTMPTDKSKHPSANINSTKLSISGNDGCNSYNATIKKLSNTEIEFNPAISTRRACGGHTVDREFHMALKKARTYEVKNRHLYLYDQAGNLLISFLAID